MGSVVGEKFSRGKECIEKNVPLVCFSASGGACKVFSIIIPNV